MKVILPDGSEKNANSGTVEEILKELGCNPYEYLAMRDKELLLEDDICKDDDVIYLTSIVHGG